MISHILGLPTQVMILALRFCLPRMSNLEKENLFLRYQLQILKRQIKRAELTSSDRSVLKVLTQNMKSWAQACFVVKPETVLKWHRMATKWSWTLHRKGRPELDPELKRLVVRMKTENRLWGAKRIHGELMKLGCEISETTVHNVLRKLNLNPLNPKPSEGWWEFIHRHQKVWAMDFFQVHTAFLKRVYIFVLMDIHTREMITARVAPTLKNEFVRNILIEEIFERGAPEVLIRDRDPSFSSKALKEVIRSNGIRELRCPRMSPKANAFVERLNGTIQRECTDHFLFLNASQIQRVLNEYREYYNRSRCHQGLGQSPPIPRCSGLARIPNLSFIAARKYLNGLHHEYFSLAA